MRTVALLTALLLTACSSKPPTEHTRYLMRTEAAQASERTNSRAEVGIRHLRIAAYLDDPGLVLETGPNEVRSARFHQWAEPLDDGLRSLLRSELSSHLGQNVDDDPARADRWTWAVDVAVDQFHGTQAGDAVLVASWNVEKVESPSRGSRRQFSERRALARPGHAALAEAQIALVGELAAAIADSLREAR